MERFRTITVLEATAILTSTIIGVGVLALPRIAAEAANTAAPLLTLISILLAFAGVALITLLGMRFPNESIILYSERILGKWLARIGSVAIILFFALLTALAAREFGTVVITSVLKRTPVDVTTLAMLLLAAIATRGNLTTFGYAHLFYLPFLLAPGVVIVALSTKNAEYLNLLPILGNNAVTRDGFFGILTVSALFQGSFIMTFVIPGMQRANKAMQATIWGTVISGGLYLSIVIATLAVFGTEELKLLLWPTLDLAKTTMLPGEVLERLDAIFLTVWVTAVYTTLYSTYTLTVRGMKDLFRLQDHRMLTFFILPYIFVMAMLPPNIIQLYKVIELVGMIGLLITIGYPSLLLMVAAIRRVRSDGHE